MERWEVLICVTHAASPPPLPPRGVSPRRGGSLVMHLGPPSLSPRSSLGREPVIPVPSEHGMSWLWTTVELSLAAHGENRPRPCPQAHSEPRQAQPGGQPERGVMVPLPLPPGDQGVQAGAQGGGVGRASRSSHTLVAVAL